MMRTREHSRARHSTAQQGTTRHHKARHGRAWQSTARQSTARQSTSRGGHGARGMGHGAQARTRGTKHGASRHAAHAMRHAPHRAAPRATSRHATPRHAAASSGHPREGEETHSLSLVDGPGVELSREMLRKQSRLRRVALSMLAPQRTKSRDRPGAGSPSLAVQTLRGVDPPRTFCALGVSRLASTLHVPTSLNIGRSSLHCSDRVCRSREKHIQRESTRSASQGSAQARSSPAPAARGWCFRQQEDRVREYTKLVACSGGTTCLTLLL